MEVVVVVIVVVFARVVDVVDVETMLPAFKVRLLVLAEALFSSPSNHHFNTAHTTTHIITLHSPKKYPQDADCIWRFIIASQEVFAFAKEDFRAIEKNGWDHPTSNRFVLCYSMLFYSSLICSTLLTL
jgi:hypothetical protein